MLLTGQLPPPRFVAGLSTDAEGLRGPWRLLGPDSHLYVSFRSVRQVMALLHVPGPSCWTPHSRKRQRDGFGLESVSNGSPDGAVLR